jgi:hypothetical protein
MVARCTALVSRAAFVGCAMFAASCSDSTAPPKATGLIFVTPPDAFATMIPPNKQPVLQLVDAQGNAVSVGSRTITASVIAGPAEIEAGATATTNASGVAAFSGLTLGTVTGGEGQVTLQFSADGLQPLTVTVGLQCALLPISISQTVSRSLGKGDCIDQGDYVNFFALSTVAPVAAFRLSFAGNFPAALLLQGPHETAYYWGYTDDPISTDYNFSYKVLLPAGQTFVEVETVQQNRAGAYTLTTAPAPEDLSCESHVPLAASPLASAQTLAAGDCVRNSFFEDLLGVGLPPQATLTASMTSSAFDPTLKVLNAYNSSVITSSTAQGTASVTLKTDTASFYYLDFTSAAASATGSYIFTLNISYPPGAVRESLSSDAMTELQRGQCHPSAPAPRLSCHARALRSKRDTGQPSNFLPQ